MRSSSHPQSTITIRLAGDGDTAALATLAQLDSASVPESPVLLADEGGQLRAALSLRDGSAVADPFHRTAAIVELLSARAAQLRGDEPARARRARGLFARVVPGTR